VNFRRDPYNRDEELAQALTGALADDVPVSVSSN
jgi:hypothetical protein